MLSLDSSKTLKMADIISIIADTCGILGFLISIYAAKEVYSIKKNNNSNKVNVSGTSVGGDFTGRDKIHKP